MTITSLIKRVAFAVMIAILFITATPNTHAASVVPIEGEHSFEEVMSQYDNQERQKENYSDLDDVFSDFTNRMVLGVFGKTALANFANNKLTDSLKDDILTLSRSERIEYSKPFNMNLAIMFLIVLKGALVVVVFLLGVYMLWMAFETLLRTQEAGEFLGKGWNKLFSPLKVMVAVLMITPMFGTEVRDTVTQGGGSSSQGDAVYEGLFFENDFTLSQVLMLRVLGNSNEYANKIWDGFVDTQQKYYPVIKMPRVTSQRSDMENLIDYVICSNVFDNKDQLELEFKDDYTDMLRTKPSFFAEKASPNCGVEVVLPFDLSTYNKLQSSNIFEDLDINVDYEQLQTENAQAVIQQILPDVVTIAYNINEMVTQINTNIRNTDAITLNYNYEVTTSNWRSHCGDFFNGEAKPRRKTYKTISQYKYFASNCLSKKLTEQQANISDITDMEFPYSPSNFFKGNKVQLCSNESEELKAITMEENSPGSIKQCIETACDSGGSFECSSAINLGLSLHQRDKIKEKGWALGGAYMYNFFSSYQNKASQELINGININYEFAADDILRVRFENILAGDTVFTVDSGYEDFNNGTKMSRDSYSSYIANYESFVPEQNRKMSESISVFGQDGFLGVSEFTECVKNPNSLHNGYQCNSVMEETQSFGMKLLVSSVQLKIINKILSFKDDMAESTYGDKMQKYKSNQSGKISNALSGRLGKSAAAIGSFGAGFGLYEVVDLLGWNQSGAFSEYEMDLLLNRDVAALGAISEGGRQLLRKSTAVGDFLITTMIILGVLMGIVLPLLPFFIFLVAFSGYVILFFESLITILVWSVVIISPSRDHSSEYIKKGFVMILSVFLRAPLIVFGLIVAWVLNNILVGELLSMLSITAAFESESTFSIKKIIDMVVVFGVQVFFLYLLYNLIFSIIEGFYEISQTWLFGNTSSSPFGSKDRKKEMENVKQGIGQMKGK